MTTLGFAVSAAALVAAGPGVPAGAQDGPGGPDGADAGRTRSTAAGHPVRKGPDTDLDTDLDAAMGLETDLKTDRDMVVAPVRIADAATVRLLRPGDRVDVVAAGESRVGGDARVLARGARVTDVPGLRDPRDRPGLPDSVAEEADGFPDMTGVHDVTGGALVLLSVPRPTAARLVGAAATARLAVTLC